MTKEELFSQIKKKQSYLCVGLDTDPNRIPAHLKQEADPIFTFNKAIIDATYPYAVAYKPNIAFYESLGTQGWESLQKTLEYIPDDVFTIADAKRGDIGNTAAMYAKAFFDTLNFDSITVAPYMGRDSVSPFLNHKDKWAIVLALTSNEGAMDFQKLNCEGQLLYEKVLQISKTWGTDENMMYVVGATRAEDFVHVRSLIPEHFLLVPGVGSQGGDLKTVSKLGMNKQCGLLVNSARGIIYASEAKDFAEKAAEEAKRLQNQMEIFLNEYML